MKLPRSLPRRFGPADAGAGRDPRRRRRRGRRPAADLPRGAEERPADRRRARRLGSHAGTGAAGAFRPAAQRFGVRRRQLQQLRFPRAETDPNSDFNRNYYQYNLTVSASQPLYRYQNVVLYDQAKQQVTQSDFTLVIAQQDLIIRTVGRLFRRAAGRIQRRAGGAAEAGRGRTAGPGQAQFRSRHVDDHRHQRSPGEIRPDRRHRNPGAERPRSPAHGAARDHRPLSEQPEARRPRLRSPAAQSRTRSTTGWTRRRRAT